MSDSQVIWEVALLAPYAIAYGNSEFGHLLQMTDHGTFGYVQFWPSTFILIQFLCQIVFTTLSISRVNIHSRILEQA